MSNNKPVSRKRISSDVSGILSGEGSAIPLFKYRTGWNGEKQGYGVEQFGRFGGFLEMKDTYGYIVKKYTLDIGNRYIVEIPNMGRNQLAELFAELKFKKGAEIGVENGAYSETLLKANPKIFLISIDPWDASVYEPGIVGIDYSQRYFNQCYRTAKKRLAPYNCHIVRKTSMEAVKSFKDNSLDFVYIDGGHDFVNVANDIHYWLKKVLSGGILSGHDYAFFPGGKQNHVKYVVTDYTKAYGIRPLFVVGAEAVGQRGVIRDKFRSWFWVKA